MQTFRAALLETEINRLRSHAARTVGRIERNLEVHDASRLAELDNNGWLKNYWERVIQKGDRQLYAAVVDVDGNVLLHSDPTRNGKRLASNWYDRVLFDVGEDVFETESPVLAPGVRCYDVRLSIELNEREVGAYHTGCGVNWFEAWTDDKQTLILRRRLLMIAGVLVIVLLATTSLYYIAAHSIMLRRSAASASLDHATEVGKLAGGLAHEIRNPLHAIQINLHSLRRVHDGRADLSEEEIANMLDQSTNEIGRIDQLMHQLVGFATPDEPQKEVIDVSAKIRDVADFIQQEMLDNNVELHVHLPPHPVNVQMDQGRLRQIMLNLLQNAQQAMEEGGRIDVGLSQRRGHVEITVTDNGPGIPDEDRDQIFEPFFSTKHDGTGLGLALVKRFVNESDGEIHYDSNSQGGATFRIVLREARPPRRK